MNTDDWLLGKHLVDVTITPLAAGSNGVLVPAATIVVTAVVDNITPDLTVQTDDVRAVNDPQINEMPISWGMGLRLSVLSKFGAINALTFLIANYKHCKVVWQAGAERHSSYHVIKGWTGGVRNRSKNTADLTLGPIKVAGVASWEPQVVSPVG